MKFNAALFAVMGLLCLQHAHAGPADYVYTPTVEDGEKEVNLWFKPEELFSYETAGEKFMYKI